ncbi:MAG: redoxin domain-containing protein [Actinomycetota bacterium]|nr:redoxin domain-containing protein [Actinomycetota bacterium]
MDAFSACLRAIVIGCGKKTTLERLGWRFHRIWSADWFANKEAAVAITLAAYNEAAVAITRSDGARLEPGAVCAGFGSIAPEASPVVSATSSSPAILPGRRFCPEAREGPRRKTSLAAGVVLVPVLAFVVVLASGFGRDPRTLPSELIGEPAPTFTLPRLGGGASVSLRSLRGQVVIVNFWASWCLACRDEHPDLLAAWERYRERGVVLIGVDFEDTEEAALAYAKEMGGD